MFSSWMLIIIMSFYVHYVHYVFQNDSIMHIIENKVRINLHNGYIVILLFSENIAMAVVVHNVHDKHNVHNKFRLTYLKHDLRL